MYLLNNLDIGKLNGVYLVCGYTDLRFGIDGLANIVQKQFVLDPFEKDVLFLFCGRRADRIKGLLWEGDGFLLMYKHLEDGRFKWPRGASEARSLSAQQYRWLMEGLHIHQRNYVREVNVKHAL